MSKRWFIVPPIDHYGGNAPITELIPKYSDQVESYAGTLTTYNGNDYWIVRFSADTNTLDSIESNADAFTLDIFDMTKSEAAQVMNDITDQDHTWSEWSEIWL